MLVSRVASLRSLPPRVNWPIVGREKEISDLDHLLQSGSRGVVVVGPPGLGKTTIVSRVLAQARLRNEADELNPAILRLPAPTPDSSPVTYFGHLLPDSLELASTFAGIADQVEATFLAKKVLIYAEDLHLLDASSASVLAVIIANGSATLIATAREDPGLPAAIDSLWRNGTLDRMDLSPLTYESVRMILRQALDDPSSNDMAYRLWSATLGNPLHVRELLFSIVEAGDVVFGGHAWTWTAPLHADRRLTDLLARDVTSLKGPERDVVDLVALAESVPLHTISAMSSDAQLKALVDRGVIVLDAPQTVGGPNVTMGHPLYAETLRSLLYPQRKRELFDSLPRQELNQQGPVGISRWVDWAIECGITPPVDALLLAASVAETMTQPNRVIKLATLALEVIVSGHGELGAASESDGQATFTALMLRARANRDSVRSEAAEADCVQAEQFVALSSGGAHDALAQIARVQADLAQFHYQDLNRALEILAKAEKSLPPSSESADGLAIEQLGRLGFAGRFEEFLANIDSALAVTTSPAKLLLAPAHVFGLAQTGRPADAYELAVKYLAQVGPEHNAFPVLRTAILSSRYWSAALMGDPALAVHFPEFEENLHQRHDAAIYQMGTGYGASFFGAWDMAVPEFRGSLARFELGAPTGLEVLVWAGLAFAYAHQGDIAGAKAAREQFWGLEPFMDRSIESVMRYKILKVGLAVGDLDISEQISDFIDWSRERNMALGVVWGLHLAVVAAAPEGRAERLDALIDASEGLQGKVPEAMITHARALIESDAGILATANAGLAAVGIWIPAPPVQIELTARQREIAALVVAGMSNKSIAQKLTISVRTVDTHVANLFARLGVGRRAELIQVLSRVSES